MIKEKKGTSRKNMSGAYEEFKALREETLQGQRIRLTVVTGSVAKKREIKKTAKRKNTKKKKMTKKKKTK